MQSQERPSALMNKRLQVMSTAKLQKPVVLCSWFEELSPEQQEPLWKQLLRRRTGHSPYLSSAWDEIERNLLSPCYLHPNFWAAMQRREQEAMHKKCHYTEAQYTLLMWCVLMTYECKWQRQQQTANKAEPESPAFFLLSWNHGKGKEKYLPSLFQ